MRKKIYEKVDELAQMLFAEELGDKSVVTSVHTLPEFWWALFMESFILTAYLLTHLPHVSQWPAVYCPLTLMLSCALFAAVIRLMKPLPQQWLEVAARVSFILLVVELLLPLCIVAVVLVAHGLGYSWADVIYQRYLYLI